MKICFLTNNYSFIGGLERVLSIVSNELSKTNDVSIISLYDLSKKCPYNYKDNIKKNIIINKNRKNYLLDYFRCLSGVKKLVYQNKYDFLIFLGENMSIFAQNACKNTTTKCIYWMHNSAWFYHYPFLEKHLRIIAIKKSNYTITLTKDSKNELIRKYSIKNIVNISNPADDVLLNKKIDYNNQSKKIITVGRISKEKNYIKLVDIASKVFSVHPEWLWDIYGDGEDKLKKEILEKIRINKLNNNLFLKGNSNNIYDLYNNYSFQVMTSMFESFPMVLVEGMSCGLPLVSFDIKTGPSEIIEDGVNGFLINDLNINTISNRIIYLIENPDKRKEMSMNNENLRLRYSTHEIGKMWIDFLTSIKNN